MKFCVFGVGGFVGGMVARSVAEVSLVAHGPHLAARRADGLEVIADGEQFTVKVPATDRPQELVCRMSCSWLSRRMASPRRRRLPDR